MKLLIIASLFFGAAAAHAHLDSELHHHVEDELPAIEVLEQKEESDS